MLQWDSAVLHIDPLWPAKLKYSKHFLSRTRSMNEGG